MNIQNIQCHILQGLCLWINQSFDICVYLICLCFKYHSTFTRLHFYLFIQINIKEKISVLNMSLFQQLNTYVLSEIFYLIINLWDYIYANKYRFLNIEWFLSPPQNFPRLEWIDFLELSWNLHFNIQAEPQAWRCMWIKAKH